MTIFSLVQLLVLFLAALATGALMVNWIGLGRAMARLSSPAYVEFHQATNATFVPYMPVIVVGAALGGIVLAALPPGLPSVSGSLALLGAFWYAAVVAISLATEFKEEIYGEPDAASRHSEDHAAQRDDRLVWNRCWAETPVRCPCRRLVDERRR